MFIRVLFNPEARNGCPTADVIESTMLTDGVARNIDRVETISDSEFWLHLKQPVVSFNKMQELQESLSRTGWVMFLAAEC